MSEVLSKISRENSRGRVTRLRKSDVVSQISSGNRWTLQVNPEKDFLGVNLLKTIIKTLKT